MDCRCVRPTPPATGWPEQLWAPFQLLSVIRSTDRHSHGALREGHCRRSDEASGACDPSRHRPPPRGDPRRQPHRRRGDHRSARVSKARPRSNGERWICSTICRIISSSPMLPSMSGWPVSDRPVGLQERQIQALSNICRCIGVVGVRVFVYGSSAGVYSSAPPGQAVDEAWPTLASWVICLGTWV